jgi:hypothetical protein
VSLLYPTNSSSSFRHPHFNNDGGRDFRDWRSFNEATKRCSQRDVSAHTMRRNCVEVFHYAKLTSTALRAAVPSLHFCAFRLSCGIRSMSTSAFAHGVSKEDNANINVLARYVLGGHVYEVLHHNRSTPVLPSLLLVYRQVRHETALLPYALNVFFVRPGGCLHQLCETSQALSTKCYTSHST